MLNIGVLGTGYVGLVTGACLASNKTNIVTCMDIDESKIKVLLDGGVPIYEKDLGAIIAQNCAEFRLQFSSDPEMLLDTFDVIFIAVGTPSNEDGTVNLDYVKSACEMIGLNCTKDKTIVMKSTVPVGTFQKLKEWAGPNHNIVSNPEFLREGTAVYDFMHGDRIVIGTSDGQECPLMMRAYLDQLDKVIWMDNASAEMTKYAANCLLASKLALWNEIAALSRKTGANIHSIREGVGSDSRIGPRFLLAGPGYGGSCFPKDTHGLHQMFTENMPGTKYGGLIKAVIDSNDHHKKLAFRVFWEATMMEWREDMKVAVLGLAFKGGTDDVRESPVYDFLHYLDIDGSMYNIVVCDPVATELPELIKPVTLTTDYVEALQDADVVVCMTEWPQFKNLDVEFVSTLMRGKIVVDARNMWDRKACEDSGLLYYGIGS